MKNITITKENLQKAYDEGCPDVKKTIKNLCPNEFEEKFYENKIYAFVHSNKEIYVIHQGKLGGELYKPYCLSLDGSGLIYEGSLDYVKQNCNRYGIKTFDNQKDFFTWALKAIS